MLGRNVYRVHPVEGRWTVIKEGEDQPRGDFARRSDALAVASALAEAQQPSRVTIDDGDGIIVEERLFGEDISQQLA